MKVWLELRLNIHGRRVGAFQDDVKFEIFGKTMAGVGSFPSRKFTAVAAE